MTKDKTSSGIITILQAVIILAGASYLLSYLFMLSKRFAYPFELEWLEGYFASAVSILLKGKPLYTKPNAHFVPFLYPPLYYWISAGLSSITGAGFIALRSISVLSSIVSGIVIFKFIKKETGNTFFSFTGMCLFFACYAISDFWYDTGRVDSLFLALVLSGLYTLKYSKRTSGIVMSSVLLSLAFYTKQSALFFLLLCPACLRHNRRQLILFSLLSAILVLGGSLLLNIISDGWYGFYCFSIPLKHYGIKKAAATPELSHIYGYYTQFAGQNYGSIKKLYLFFTTDLLSNIPFLIAPIICWFLYRLKLVFKNGNVLFFTLTGLASLLCSISMRCKLGGHVNGIIPAIAIIIIISTIVFSRIYLRHASGQPFRIMVLVCIILQFVMLKYNPENHIPGPEDLMYGNKLTKKISGFPDDVYIPFHPYYAAMAGKDLFAHKMPIDDMYIGYPEMMPEDLMKKISSKGFSAVVYDRKINEGTENPVEKQILTCYTAMSVINYKSPDSFMPVSGFKTRPAFIYTPKQRQ